MAEINQCPLFWIENPNILVTEAADFYPFSENAKICSTTALNSLTRFTFYLGILLFVITQRTFYLGVPVLGAILAVSLYYGMKQQGTLRRGAINQDKPSFMEGFANIEGSAASDKVLEDIIGQQDRTGPIAKNPFMNVLINEIADFPTKPPAKYSASGTVKPELESQFQTKVYGDPADVWNRNQGQREFYTMPSTSIPNDRDSYQNWLYRIPGKTCKEGNMAACTTEGSSGSQYVFLGQ
jgi:hypothetical protein